MAHINPAALRKAMDLARMSPTRLAEQVGVSKQYINDILSGRRTMQRKPDIRARIAEALDVPIHWIEQPEPLLGKADDELTGPDPDDSVLDGEADTGTEVAEAVAP